MNNVRSEVKTTIIAAKLPLALGAVLIFAGLVVSPSALIGFLRTTPESLREPLILGATLFKVGLVLDGIFILALAWGTGWRLRPREEKFSSDPRTASFFLAAILLAAFLLRLYNLDSGIWFDEIITYVLYANRPFGEILTTYDNQNNHVLYTLLARLSFWSFGESVWSLRLPAVLFGVGSIWAVYLFARHAVTWKEGLFAAALLTFSYHHVWFSQNARGYTALLFWTILSSWLLVRALSEARLGLWLTYGFAAALGMLTHVTMAFVVVAHGVVYLLSLYDSNQEKRREQWLGGLIGFAVAGLLTFQLYALVLPQLLNWQGGGVSSWQGRVDVTPWKSPLWILKEIRSANLGPGGDLLIFLAGLVFGVGIVDLARKKSPIIVLFGVSVLAGLAVIAGLGSTLLPRFFFYAMGFAAIVLVRGLVLSGNFLSGALRLDPVKGPLVGVALCLAAVGGSGISLARAYQPKQDYGAALEFVQNERRPGDAVLTVGLTVFPYERFYKADWGKVTTVEELNRARSRGTRTWLVYTMPVVLQAAYPEIKAAIDAEFETVKKFSGTLNGGEIVVALAKSPLR
ncbi:MAG: glycosyltransferase family 39 protein [Candidatus Binatia bacterium]